MFDETLAAVDRGDLPRYLLLDSAPHLGGVGRTSLSSVDHFTEFTERAAELGFTDVVTHWPRPDRPTPRPTRCWRSSQMR